MKKLRFKHLRSQIFIAIIFFILLFGSSNVLASTTYIYGVPTQSDFGDDTLGGLREALFDIEKANMTLEMVGQTADSLSRLPDTYEKMKGKGKTLLNKTGVMSDDYVIENANPEDVERIEKILDANGIKDPEKRKEHIAREILQYESTFGGVGIVEAEEIQVLKQNAQAYSAREMAYNYAYADEKLRQMQEGELEERIYAASDVSQKVGEDFENQLMTDLSGYGKDTAGLVNDVNKFEDANAYEKIEIADRTLDRLNNFGEGNDSNLMKDQILSKIDNETVNDMVNGLEKYGQYNPMTEKIDFSDNFNPGNGGPGSYMPGYGENPSDYGKNEYMQKVEEAGYTPEDMVYIAEKLVPPEYHGAITLAKTALGMRLVIPGSVQLKADANPEYPLVGVQGEYTIGTRTSSKIIEPCDGFLCTPTIRDAGIEKVTAEIKHNKYPTRKSALRGVPTKNSSIEGLKYTSNPFKQSGTYTLVVQSVDEAFVSTEMTYKIEVRAKDTSLTGDNNPIRDNSEEKNIETGKEYNPDGGSNNLDGDEDSGFAFPGFEKNREARHVRDNRHNDKYSNGSSNNFWTTDNPMFNFSSDSSGNNNDTENNNKNNGQNSYNQNNSTNQNSNTKNEQSAKNSTIDKAYNSLFGKSSNSESKNSSSENKNMYDRFFGNQKEVSDKTIVNYNGTNNEDKILKLAPEKTQENKYERDKKLNDFIKYNEQEIYNRGFNKLNDQDKVIYPIIAKKHGLVEDTREFYTENEVIELPNMIEEQIFNKIGDKFVKNQLSIKVNGDYQSIISNTYTALNEETEKALGNIQMVFKPNESAYGYNPNTLEIGLAFKGKNDNRQIQYLKIEKKSNGYQVYSMNPSRSNKINKYWDKIDGFVLNEAEYKEIQKGLAEKKFE